MICGFCEMGTLHEKVIERKFERDGYTIVVPNYKVSVCDCCGAQVTSAQQARDNQRAKNAAEAAHFGLLSGEAIKCVREKLGLSQADAAEVFGGGTNAFYKYERSEVIVSQAMDLLIRLANELPDASNWLLARSGRATKPEWTLLGENEVSLVGVTETLRLFSHQRNMDVPANNDWYDTNGDLEQTAYG